MLYANTKIPEACVINHHPEALMATTILLERLGLDRSPVKLSIIMPGMGVSKETINAVKQCEQCPGGCLGQVALASAV